MKSTPRSSYKHSGRKCSQNYMAYVDYVFLAKHFCNKILFKSKNVKYSYWSTPQFECTTWNIAFVQHIYRNLPVMLKRSFPNFGFTRWDLETSDIFQRCKSSWWAEVGFRSSRPSGGWRTDTKTISTCPVMSS